MKLFKYLLIGLSSLVFLTFTSCEDYLEAKSESGFADDVIFSDSILTEQFLNSVYDHMAEDKVYRKGFDQFYYGNTDLEKHNGTLLTYSRTDTYSTVSYNAISNNTAVQNPVIWDGIYRCIEMCNIAIDRIPEFSSPAYGNKMGVLYAEALTMRAYLYYDLIKYYGDVPARFEPLTKEILDVYPSDRDLIYKQILSDLQVASSYAVWGGTSISNSIERPTKESILGLYARIALSYVGYAQRPLSTPAFHTLSTATNSTSKIARTVDDTEKGIIMAIVRDSLSSVITKWGTSRLDTDYENIFVNFMGGGIDPLSSEYLWSFNYRSYLALTWAMPCPSGDYTEKKIQSKWKATPTFYFDYDQNDLRKDVTCPLYEYVTSSSTGTLHPIVAKVNEIPFGKFRAEWIVPMIDKDGDAFKVPIMRYSDILLMYAEATLTAGNGAAMSGQAAMDLVRSRAGLGSKPLTLDNIIDERAFEFAGERIRRDDLIRWGKLSEKIKEASARTIDLANATAGSDFAAFTHVAANNGDIFWRPTTEKFTGTSMNKFELYGLYPGETDDKAVTDSLGGWSKVLTDDSASPSSNYKFWTTGGNSRLTDPTDGDPPYYDNFYTIYFEPDEHQLMPFADNTIANSKGYLENVYGY